MSPSSYQPLSSECDHSVTLRDRVRHTKFLRQSAAPCRLQSALCSTATMASSSSLPSASFNDYNSQIQGSALKATRAALSLPADIPFHRSVHPNFAKEVDRTSARVLSLTNKLLQLSSTANSSANTRGKGKARLEIQDDVVDNFHSLVVDAMDTLLERAVSM